MTAVVVQSIGGTASSTSVGSGTLGVTPVPGSLLLIVANTSLFNNAGQGAATPAGYVQVSDSGGVNTDRIQVFAKTAGGAEPTSVTVTFTTLGTPDINSVEYVEVSGCSSTVRAQAAGAMVSGAGSSIAVQTGDFVLVAASANSGGTYTAASPFALLRRIANAFHELTTYSQVAASTGSVAATWTGTGANATNATVAFIPTVIAAPSLKTDACRVEVAWGTTSALSTSPAWEDMSSTVALEQGITWNRGRPDGQSQVSAGQLAFALRNDAGTYTPGLISSSRYPNVVLGRRARVTVRPSAAGPGNFLSAEDASFEGGTTGTWQTAVFGFTAGTIANDATRAQVGTKALLITWATSAASAAGVFVGGLVIGRTYTASAYVWVPVGSPAVTIDIFGTGPGTSTGATTAAWVRLSKTFVATSTSHFVDVQATSTGAGQQAWVDAVQLDEGSAAVTFTTAAPAITVRLDGTIDSLVVGMTSTGAVTFVGASDLLKQLGDNRPMRSILSEEILNDIPICYWPLGEPSGVTTAGDVSGAVSIPVLTATQRGAGGTLTFGVGTGPAFDGATAAVLTPASTVNGLYLTAAPPVMPTPFGVTLGCFLNTSTAAAQGVVKILDSYGTYLTLEVTAAGKLLGSLFDASSATTVGTVTSAGNVTGGTKHVAVTVGLVGTAATVTLWLDGVSAGTAAWTQSTGLLYGWSVVNVGGSATDPLLTGTVSHVYVTSSALSSGRISEQRKAGLTGFVGELSGTREARLLRLAGLPSALVNCEAGLSTMAQQSTAGTGPLTASQDVVNAERGVLFAAGDGRVTFHGRSHRYNAAATATFDAVNDLGSPDLSSTLNDQVLINDVSGTRPSGASQRAVNASSVNLNGTFATSLSMLVDSDALAQQLLQSMANTYSVPQPRAPELNLDLLTVADATVTAALALDVGARVDVVSLPAQAPSSTLSLFTEGLRESVTPRSWDLTVSTSPATYTAAWVLDSATYSQLDSSTILTV